MADPVATSSPTLPWWVVPSLATYAMTIFAGLAAASCFVADNTLRTTMFTASITLMVAASAFYFGSSSGSEKKDSTIAGTAAALATSAPVAIAETDEAKALEAKLSAATG